MTNVYALFDDCARRNLSHIAIIDRDGKTYSYQELLCLIASKVSYYQSKNLKTGDKVLILIPMGIDLYVNILAMFSIGLIPVFLDQWVDSSVMKKCLDKVPCLAIVAPYKIILLSYLMPIGYRFGIKLLSNGMTSKKAMLSHISIDPKSTALITFTTGSTGTPKAADRTHEFLLEQFKATSEILDSFNSNMDIPMLPIVLLLNMARARTSVIANTNFARPDKFNAKAVSEQICKYQVQSITTSPYFMLKIARELPLISSLKTINIGGGPLHKSEAKEILGKCSNVNLQLVYGSTEAEPIAHFNANDYYLNEDYSVGIKLGRPINNIELAIINIEDSPIICNTKAQFNSLKLKPEEIGEIVVYGKHVLTNYINDEYAFQRNKIRVEDKIWHRTGDAAYMDDQGVLFLCGRINQHIKLDDGSVYNTFLLEIKVKDELKVKDCAIWYQNRQFVVCVEPINKAQDHKELSNKIKLIIDVPHLVFIHNIIKDKRHHSKTNYDAMRDLIKQG